MDKAARIQELEAAGFRCIRSIEEHQNVLRNIAQEIARLQSAPSENSVEPELQPS